MDTASQLVARNAEFASSFSDAHRTAAPELSTVVLTCLDPRVDPAHILGLGVGEAAVIRVLGGRVSEQVERDLAVYCSITAGADAGLLVVVIHHTDCGAAVLAQPGEVRDVADRTGVAAQGLETIACADPADSVRSDIRRLAGSECLPAGLRFGGYVYDTSNGRLREVVTPGSR